jgi:enamine deaminase RidA (YjgF/YER057c/UK114 family)
VDLLQRIASSGLTLPSSPPALGSYVPARRRGDLVWTSGQLPIVAGELLARGLVGADVDLDTAVRCARQAALNGIAAAVAAIASPDDLAGVLKVTGYVASAPGFTDQPAVLNGASDLLVDLFGDAGRHVRSAVGVAALPLGAPVEVEIVFIASDGQ